MAATRRTLLTAAVSAAALWNARAHAAVFMDLDQARRVLLPQAVSWRPVVLDAAAPAALAQAGLRAPAGWQPLATAGLDAQGALVGHVLADRVLGKYEQIDFAAAFAPDGSVTGMEILAYRESHGAEVRNPAWRRQFAGRRGPAQLRFGEEIRNISGATLSCQHLTEGMQRLAALALQLRG